MDFSKALNNRNLEAELKTYSDKLSSLYLPSLSINTVIFSYYEDRLRVLLLRFADSDYFMLPGGFVKKDENLSEASLRVLQERTGLKDIYLDQFYTSGDINRKSEDIVRDTFLKLKIKIPENSWIGQRYISVCYYALIDETKVDPKITEFFITGFEWADVQKLPALMYDHDYIIEKAIVRLQTDLERKLVARNLLTRPFTMNELQKLYEAVFQKAFARNNFQRKILGSDILVRLEKRYNGKSHKAPYLYKFKE